MKIKIILITIISIIGAASICHAQASEPSMGSESSSRGVWPSVDSGTDSSSAGYDSGNHGNVS